MTLMFRIFVGNIFSAVTLHARTLQIRGMHTLIRDKDIATNDFVFYSDRLIRLVICPSLYIFHVKCFDFIIVLFFIIFG